MLKAIHMCEELGNNETYAGITRRLSRDNGESPDDLVLEALLIVFRDLALETNTINDDDHRGALWHAFRLAYAIGYDRRVKEESLPKFVVADE